MRRDRGFAAITAVFIVFVLAAIGAVLVTISSGQARSQAMDVLGVKAYQSAQAGVEGAVATVLSTGACPPAGPFQLATAPALQDFYVQVTCTPFPPYNDAGGTLNMFEIQVTACNDATCPNNATAAETYVERQLRATVCRGSAC
jgi:MSHA biogenesis protein MshP